MAQIETIARLTTSPLFVEFATYVLSQSDDGKLPDYLTMNLMDVPHLVPRIFVLDVQNSVGKLRSKFSGTVIDSFYGVNMSGKCPIDHYKGEGTFDEIEAIFWKSIRTKTPAYTCRPIHLVNEYVDRFKVAETLLFPCTSDGTNVNYAIGLADYFDINSAGDRCITLIE